VAVPEFTPTAAAPSAAPGGGGSSRPLGRLLIYTLREERVAEFDRLAEQAADGVRASEPDTLVYVFHTVPTEPMQRIIYEIYRDRAAFESHQRQPHIQRFTDGVKPCILGSNAIELRLKYAKVAPLQGTGQSGGKQPGKVPPVDSLSPAGRSSGGHADADPTARHRVPPPPENTSRSFGDDLRSDRAERASSGGGRRRGEAADDWAPEREWGR
jgi:quinol monooxygenase YgiN